MLSSLGDSAPSSRRQLKKRAGHAVRTAPITVCRGIHLDVSSLACQFLFLDDSPCREPDSLSAMRPPGDARRRGQGCAGESGLVRARPAGTSSVRGRGCRACSRSSCVEPVLPDPGILAESRRMWGRSPSSIACPTAEDSIHCRSFMTARPHLRHARRAACRGGRARGGTAGNPILLLIPDIHPRWIMRNCRP